MLKVYLSFCLTWRFLILQGFTDYPKPVMKATDLFFKKCTCTCYFVYTLGGSWTSNLIDELHFEIICIIQIIVFPFYYF